MAHSVCVDLVGNARKQFLNDQYSLVTASLTHYMCANFLPEALTKVSVVNYKCFSTINEFSLRITFSALYWYHSGNGIDVERSQTDKQTQDDYYICHSCMEMKSSLERA